MDNSRKGRYLALLKGKDYQSWRFKAHAYCLRKGYVDIIKNEHPSTSGRQQTEVTVWRWRDITDAIGQPLRDHGGRTMEQHVSEVQTSDCLDAIAEGGVMDVDHQHVRGSTWGWRDEAQGT